MKASPFAALLEPPRARLPQSTSVTVVVGGKRITSADQIKGRDEEAAAAKEAVEKAKRSARYQADRLNPEAMAKRADWAEANREKHRAYKKEWDAKNVERNRELKRAWAKRDYTENADARRATSKAYYQAHREEILARLKAARVASKAMKLKAAKT